MTYSFVNRSSRTVVQLTDPHLFASPESRLLNINTNNSLQGVIQHIQAHHADIDLLLATGDISQDGSKTSYERFRALTQVIPAPLRVLPGNHDINASLCDVLGEHALAVTDVGNWRIICLDSSVPASNGGQLAADQLDLLATAARQAPDQHILLALHHNPVPIGSLWLDTMMVENPEALFKLVDTLPHIRAISWGHVHQEYDTLHITPAHPQGIRLLATPSTCVQFTPQSDTFSLDNIAPGYRWFTLYPDGQLETGVNRVEGLGLQPDSSSGGY